ncbi:phosphate ABC transporter substrate-binding/OmpA family protein [Halioxenophilus sp. WMMB6]|uniref:phosphate ABC transporter substrate-binding/OmpA family protein n=1 Tax=Halioxenophilus sp. WMMB6 TaxID=3073815 RepID=UPI00295F2619|nr:phosphate ABC transporter substrate-binding/OmpA family protein [Halioxenophilus sp. WMMB6]
MRLLPFIFLLWLTQVSPHLLAQTRHEALFTLHGSNTIGSELAPRLVQGFLQGQGYRQVIIKPGNLSNETRVEALTPSSNQTVAVIIEAHGTATGFGALKQNPTDIAMASRAINSEELRGLSQLGNMRSFSSEHIIAIDGVAVIVHPHNPLAELTLDQLAAIFSGHITNWAELGGANAEIHLYARDGNSGTADTFKSLVLSDQPSLSGDAQLFESNRALADAVAKDENGIGFVGLAAIAQCKPLAIGQSGVDALKPEQIAIATEDYLLSRRLYLYSADQPEGSLPARFLRYVHGAEAQALVAKSGFVSQTPIAMQVRPDDGPAEYLALVKDAQRLSVNIRFHEGSAELDNKAKHDIERLIQLAKTEAFRHRKLLLVGFGDQQQTDDRALVLSRLRAITVKAELHANGIRVAPVAGFGAANPVAANTGSARLRNQRVEVWVL